VSYSIVLSVSFYFLLYFVQVAKSNQCDVDYAKANDIFAELEKQSSIFSVSHSGKSFSQYILKLVI